MTSFLHDFDVFIDSMADEETTTWPLMKSASRMLLALIGYVLLVTYLGPKLMENRKPYNLKKIIIVYNTFQVIVCSTLFIWVRILPLTPINRSEVFTLYCERSQYIKCSVIYNAYSKIKKIRSHDWNQIFQTKPSFGCEPLSKERTEESLTFARICWWTMLLKMAELIETVFFVLRKKQNQVSALHVYHHTSTLIIVWGSTKMFPSKMVLTPIMINSLVHMLMYTYYLLSAIGPEVQRKIAKWKKHITIIQMIQFCVLLAFTTQIVSPYCNVPNTYAYIFIPNVFLVFYMFYQFYKQSYLKRRLTNKVE